MKVPVLSSLLLVSGLSSTAFAIERPKSLDTDESKAKETARVVQGEEDALKEKNPDPEADPEVRRPAGAWLGVLSEPIDETLSVHLGVDDGVVLDYVAPDSPASAAGLKQHDIVTKVDGQVIASQDELRAAIQGHKPGDEISLTVISKGKEDERKVRLGERPQALPGQAPRGPAEDREDDLELGLRFGNFENLEELQNLDGLEKLLPDGVDLQKQLEGHMKRLEKQLREMERRGGADLKMDFDLFERLPKPRKGGALQFDFKASSSFKFVDEDGSVEMKTTDGGKEVVVKDPDGKLLFEGPWDTPQDKAAAPEGIRERVESMNNGKRFQFRLENLPKPDVEIPEKKEPEFE